MWHDSQSVPLAFLRLVPAWGRPVVDRREVGKERNHRQSIALFRIKHCHRPATAAVGRRVRLEPCRHVACVQYKRASVRPYRRRRVERPARSRAIQSDDGRVATVCCAGLCAHDVGVVLEVDLGWGRRCRAGEIVKCNCQAIRQRSTVVPGNRWVAWAWANVALTGGATSLPLGRNPSTYCHPLPFLRYVLQPLPLESMHTFRATEPPAPSVDDCVARRGAAVLSCTGLPPAVIFTVTTTVPPPPSPPLLLVVATLLPLYTGKSAPRSIP